jgi:hypothetical protein
LRHLLRGPPAVLPIRCVKLDKCPGRNRIEERIVPVMVGGECLTHRSRKNIDGLYCVVHSVTAATISCCNLFLRTHKRKGCVCRSQVVPPPDQPLFNLGVQMGDQCLQFVLLLICQHSLLWRVIKLCNMRSKDTGPFAQR